MSQSSSESVAKKSSPILQYIQKWWWIPASYFIPYGITLLIPMTRFDDTLMRAGRTGYVGLLAATLVYFLWLADCKLGARQFLARSNDKVAKVLVYCLGVVLWVCFFGSGIVMTMTYDQVYSLGDTPTYQVP